MKDNKSRLLFICVAILLVLSITATGYRYLVVRDYEVYDDTGETYEDE